MKGDRDIWSATYRRWHVTAFTMSDGKTSQLLSQCPMVLRWHLYGQVSKNCIPKHWVVEILTRFIVLLCSSLVSQNIIQCISAEYQPVDSGRNQVSIFFSVAYPFGMFLRCWSARGSVTWDFTLGLRIFWWKTGRSDSNKPLAKMTVA